MLNATRPVNTVSVPLDTCDIKAKAIVTVAAVAHHLPGRPANEERNEKRYADVVGILGRGYLGTREIYTASVLTDQLLPLLDDTEPHGRTILGAE